MSRMPSACHGASRVCRHAPQSDSSEDPGGKAFLWQPKWPLPFLPHAHARLQDTLCNTGVQRSGFGELALLYSSPRAASVLAITDCKLWVMERAVYLAIKRTYQEQLAALKRKMVASVPILAVLSEVALKPYIPHTLRHRNSPGARQQCPAAGPFVVCPASSKPLATNIAPLLDGARLWQVSPGLLAMRLSRGKELRQVDVKVCDPLLTGHQGADSQSVRVCPHPDRTTGS